MREVEQLQEGLGKIKELKRGQGGKMLSDQFMRGGKEGFQSGSGRAMLPGAKGGKKSPGYARTLSSFKRKDEGPGIGRGSDPNLYGKPERSKPKLDPYLMRANEGEGKSEYFQVKSAREAGRSAVDYKNIFVNYKRLAENTLHNEEIPIGYREYVKRYFDNLLPPEDSQEGR